VKVSNRFFENDDINKIALAAPTATLIEIRNFNVADKKSVEVPDSISKFVKCVNPKCITNHEMVITRFNLIDKENVKLQCDYCEKVTDETNMEFL
jgi:aspartate carbamoyltransferase regulatory subunit